MCRINLVYFKVALPTLHWDFVRKRYLALFPKQTRNLGICCKWRVDITLRVIYRFTVFLSPLSACPPPRPCRRSVILLSDNASFSPRLRSGIYMKLLIVCSSNRVSLEPAVCQKLRTDSLTSLPPHRAPVRTTQADLPPGWSAWQSTGRSRASWHHPLRPTSENTTTINLTSTEMRSRVFRPAA